ncbi:hypothetical protein GCM10027449_20810 [Sinomonas notoginsengisoli]
MHDVDPSSRQQLADARVTRRVMCLGRRLAAPWIGVDDAHEPHCSQRRERPDRRKVLRRDVAAADNRGAGN